MTPDQMAELAARLRKQAQLGGDPACCVRAADLIDSMAQRVPLSTEQIHVLVQPMDWPPSVTEIVRAVEQAHGIRSEK